jgi:seryl-tRNA synthetase
MQGAHQVPRQWQAVVGPQRSFCPDTNRLARRRDRSIALAATATQAPVASTGSSNKTEAVATSLPAASAYKAALDFKWFKDNLEAVERNAKERKSAADPRKAVELYDSFVKLKLDVDRLRAERNANSAQMKVREQV